MQSNKETHLFKSNSKFEDVVHLYNFDRELRVILFDAIEKIEMSLTLGGSKIPQFFKIQGRLSKR